MEEISQTYRRGAALKTRLCLILVFAVFMQPLHADKPGKAAIASAHYLATEAGHEILAKGGNAFDAAVAVSSVLAVVEQTSSGVGGGGFWLLHRASDGFEIMIDGREMAPAAADKDMYLNEDGSVNRDLALNGPLAAAIPGEIAGLEHLAVNYGNLSLAENLQPAIGIAREGFPVYTKLHGMLGYKAKTLRRWPAASSIYLPGDKVPEMGQLIKLPDLADILEKVASQGRDAFYKGEVAQRLVNTVAWGQADPGLHRW